MATPEDPRDPPPNEPPAPFPGRWSLAALLVWGIAVLSVTAGIAGETAFWPVVPLVGAAVPIFLAFLYERNRREALRGSQVSAVLALDDRAEREVLGVLKEVDGLTPMGAEVLERLAGRGHLDVSARDGAPSKKSPLRP